MKRLIGATCFAMACSVGVAFAQYDKPQAPKDQDKSAKGDTVTLTGCVADKDAKGHFMLNNASAAPSSPSSTTTPPTTTASSFILTGGGDLKAHVGHKVEVTGTIDQNAKMSKPSDTATGTSGTTPDKSANAETLKVKSVKMVAETCQ